jgi:hypothetical protein
MQSTFATVIVPIEFQERAKQDFPDYFSTKFTTSTEENAPATHCLTSGYFYNSELESISNQVDWTRIIKFGDLQAVLSELNLHPVQEVIQDEPDA